MVAVGVLTDALAGAQAVGDVGDCIMAKLAMHGVSTGATSDAQAADVGDCFMAKMTKQCTVGPYLLAILRALRHHVALVPAVLHAPYCPVPAHAA
eukprot:10032650-Alexandrium_andersonii.AAC.1